ncbi:MAG: DsbA family protein [Rhodospirillales bacterium]
MRLARMLGAVLAVLVLGAPPAAAAEDALNPAQKRAVEDVVREYLRSNPEVLLEAIGAIRAKRDAEQQAKVRDNLVSLRGELENDPASPVGGNPRGNVTIVEFFDYQCPYCKRVFPSVQNLLKTDGNIRYVFKEFPILGPQSVVAARAALAAWKLDRDTYVPFHTALLRSKGRLSERKIMEVAAQSGLDVKRLRAAMADPGIDKVLARNAEMARALDINGTPGFVIGETVVPGAVDLETLTALVSKARGG